MSSQDLQILKPYTQYPIGSVLTRPFSHFGSVFYQQKKSCFQLRHIKGSKEMFWMIWAFRKVSLLPQQRMVLILIIFLYKQLFTQLQCLKHNLNCNRLHFWRYLFVWWRRLRRATRQLASRDMWQHAISQLISTSESVRLQRAQWMVIGPNQVIKSKF